MHKNANIETLFKEFCENNGLMFFGGSITGAAASYLQTFLIPALSPNEETVHLYSTAIIYYIKRGHSDSVVVASSGGLQNKAD